MSKGYVTTVVAIIIAAPLLVYGGLPSPSPGPSFGPTSPPAILTLLKAEQGRRLTSEREILASASLKELPGKNAGKLYSFYTAMQVKADLARTRRILTDYTLYANLIPYVDMTSYSPITRILDVEGGVWKWRLRSQIRFDERSDHWIHYQVVGGHFRGLEGDMYFEEAQEKGVTLVYFRGEQQGTAWPPKLVIEHGAEIVFGFTAGRMRKYVESREESPAQEASGKNPNEKNSNDGQNFPQPRNRL